MITKNKKKKPKFNVMNLGFFKSVKARWRKPRGTHNKKRMKFKWAGASPRIGYRNPVEMRGIHPTGAREALVHNLAELDALKGVKGVLVRIASAVGARKRALMAEKAKAMNLRIANMKADVKGAAQGAKVFGKSKEAKGAAIVKAKPETKPETGDRKPETGTRKPAGAPAPTRR